MTNRPRWRVRAGRLLKWAIVLALFIFTAPVWTLALRVYVFGESPPPLGDLDLNETTLAAIRQYTEGDFVHGISPETAYNAFVSVARYPEAAEKVGCYCMCDVGGHKSLRACFYKRISKDGDVEFNQHGKLCPICIAEAGIVGQQAERGLSPDSIQDIIAQRYRGWAGSILSFTWKDVSRYYGEWREVVRKRSGSSNQAEAS